MWIPVSWFAMLFWTAAVAQPVAPPPPLRATNACAEGVKNYPFLKQWVAKFENFIAPVETGAIQGSLIYALGATTVGKKALDPWRTERVTLDLGWKEKNGKFETQWLGSIPAKALPANASLVRAGPGGESIGAFAKPPLEISGGDPQWGRMWSLFFSPAELDLLLRCGTPGDCKIKFNEAEMKRVFAVSHQYRLNQFYSIILKRLESFAKTGDIWSYEGTDVPLAWREMRFNIKDFAQFSTHFWLPDDRSTFGYEMLDAEPGRHKPVVSIFNRSCSKRADGPNAPMACQDLVLYNNHYFDFWARVIFFFPWCETQIALVYEVLDVDQLKGRKLVSMLFGSDMRKSVETLVETRLKRLHMLGF